MITTESRKLIVNWQGGYVDVFIEKMHGRVSPVQWGEIF